MPVRPAVVDPGVAHRNTADPGLNLPFRHVAVGNQPPPALLVDQVLVGAEKSLDLGLDRTGQKTAGTGTQHFRQRIAERYPSVVKGLDIRCETSVSVGVSLRGWAGWIRLAGPVGLAAGPWVVGVPRAAWRSTKRPHPMIEMSNPHREISSPAPGDAGPAAYAGMDRAGWLEAGRRLAARTTRDRWALGDWAARAGVTMAS